MLRDPAAEAQVAPRIGVVELVQARHQEDDSQRDRHRQLRHDPLREPTRVQAIALEALGQVVLDSRRGRLRKRFEERGVVSHRGEGAEG